MAALTLFFAFSMSLVINVFEKKIARQKDMTPTAEPVEETVQS